VTALLKWCTDVNPNNMASFDDAVNNVMEYVRLQDPDHIEYFKLPELHNNVQVHMPFITNQPMSPLTSVRSVAGKANWVRLSAWGFILVF